MRRLLIIVLLLCFSCGLFVGVKAASAAENIQSFVTVAGNGSCQVTLTVSLHLDQPVDKLKFPLPESAEYITLNGKRVRGRVENGARQIDLSSIAGKTAGNFTFTLAYSLTDLVMEKNGQMELQLPLLSGFAYPVQALTFSVTMPGEMTEKPSFVSGYYQTAIENDLSVTTDGNTITGQTLTELKDHETLSMQLLTAPEMFPGIRKFSPALQMFYIVIALLVLLAVAYWVIFLRNFPRFPKPRSTPPDGFGAGELGSVLFLQGGNLNMLVLAWAELGYLQIQRRGKNVMLYRRMDMGNERSNYEQHWFKLLFAGRTAVTATTRRYADLCGKVASAKPNLNSLIHPKSGNITIFRVLGAGIGGALGAVIASQMSQSAVLAWFLMILFGVLAALSGWYIQSWITYLLSPEKRRLWSVAILCGIWLLIAQLTGVLSTGILFIFSQLLVGVFAAFGGRRTEAGKQAQNEVLALRRYLTTVPPEQLRLICQNNPDYFHQMSVYAIALGVHKQFAKRFGKLPITPCPYLEGGPQNITYAYQWADIMGRVLTGMSTHQYELGEILRRYLKQ